MSIFSFCKSAFAPIPMCLHTSKRTAYLQDCLLNLPLSQWSMEQIARQWGAHSLRSTLRLITRLERMANRLKKTGRISSERWEAITRLLSRTDPEQLEESLSPYHTLLEEKDFYKLSGRSTRRLFRRFAADFAKRHRLSPQSAVLLWKGERTPPSRSSSLFLLFALLPPLMILVVIFHIFPLTIALWSLLTLPVQVLGSYLFAASLLNQRLPSSPLPLLESGEGHPVLVVGIGRIDDPFSALTGIERILCAGNSDCRYHLLLTHRDALLEHTAGEEDKEKQLRTDLDLLAKRYDVTIEASVIPRRFDVKEKKWKGDPTFPTIVRAIRPLLDPADEGVCILPTDGTILPGTIERLSAALFHPFCKGSVLTFLYPNDSPLPCDRLAKLRRVLLQKMDAPADWNGYGMLRADALRAWEDDGHTILPRLSSETLYLPRSFSAFPTRSASAPHFAPFLLFANSLCRPILLWGLIHFAFSMPIFLFLTGLSLFDLWCAMLLSFPRKNRGAIRYTQIALFCLGKEALTHLILPTKQLSDQLSTSATLRFSLTLLFGCGVIASGAPLSFLGIFWIVSPILFPTSFSVPTHSPMEKAACHALAKEIALQLPVFSNQPPAMLINSPHSVTNPITLGLHGAAMLACFSLGLWDQHTLERELDALLQKIESLPHKCGLPYAEYRLEGSLWVENGMIDSYSCGIFALCMASLEEGIREYLSKRSTATHPLSRIAEWTALLHRLEGISTRMNFELLLSPEGELCRQLNANGERMGSFSHLCEKGGLTWFAALSSDSLLFNRPPISTAAQKKYVFAKLLPPTGKSIPSGITTEALYDYLLPLILLPIDKGSPMDYGADCAIRQLTRNTHRSSGKRTKASLRSNTPLSPENDPALVSPTIANQFTSLLSWPHLETFLPSSSPRKERSAPPYCLLLSRKPRYALSHLQHLQKYASFGGFTASDDPSHLSIDALSIGLITIEHIIRPIGFAQRIQSLPRCACLTPLLSHLPPAIRPTTPPMNPPPSPASPESPAPFSAPLVLWGDCNRALLFSRHLTFSLWQNRRAITYPQEVSHGFFEGRPSGILLRRTHFTAPIMEPEVFDQSALAMHLQAEKIDLTLSSVQQDGWLWTFRQSDSAHTEFRLIFCPAAHKGRPIRLTTLVEEENSRLRLLIEIDTHLALLFEVSGITDSFTYADPSPLPKGRRQIDSIFDLRASNANGLVHTPTCILGGNWCSPSLTVRLLISSHAADLLQRSEQWESTDSSPLASDSADSPKLLHPHGSGAEPLLLTHFLSELFAGKPLPRLSAISHPPLSLAIRQTENRLQALGFPCANTLPLPLTVSGRESTESVLRRLLASPTQDGETPMLPQKEIASYPNGYLRLTRGRNHAAFFHGLSNRWLFLKGNPHEFALHSVDHTLILPISILRSVQNNPLLLPEGAVEIDTLPGKLCYRGDDFQLTACLLPDLPCLILELCAEGDAQLHFPTLPSPEHSASDGFFWHLQDPSTLFLHAWQRPSVHVWMIGIFNRLQDRSYYLMKEQITFQTYSKILHSHCTCMQEAVETLRILPLAHSDELPSLPALALSVLSSPSPAKALLSPLCTPHRARDDLLALANGPSSLLLPAALLLYTAIFPDDHEICQTPVPTEQGTESLYLHAARVLEAAMESAPQTPLLPTLVQGFAKLSTTLHDPTASLYHEFCPIPFTDRPPYKKDPHWNCQLETLDCLDRLQRKEKDSAEQLWTELKKQLLHPSPNDIALLWNGVLWSLLGFAPHHPGATFSPLSRSQACTAYLRFGQLYQIDLSPASLPV